MWRFVPGHNTVIREIVCDLCHTYGVTRVVGIDGGYRGFYSRNTIPLNPKVVNNISLITTFRLLINHLALIVLLRKLNTYTKGIAWRQCQTQHYLCSDALKIEGKKMLQFGKYVSFRLDTVAKFTLLFLYFLDASKRIGSSGMRNATRCGLWWAEMLKTRDQCKEAATLYFRISGLQAVQNPGEIFLGEPQIDTEEFTGQVVAVMMDGSQSFIVVVQICRYFSDPQNYFQDNDHYVRNKFKVVLFPILDKVNQKTKRPDPSQRRIMGP